MKLQAALVLAEAARVLAAGQPATALINWAKYSRFSPSGMLRDRHYTPGCRLRIRLSVRLHQAFNGRP
ncbi:MAG: hypothetical protein WCE68_10585 [Anaerolineales bacterium]